MISTRLECGRNACRAGAVALLGLMAACVHIAIAQDEQPIDLAITVTAFGSGTSADVGGDRIGDRGPTLQYVSVDPLTFAMVAGEGIRKQAILLLNDEERAVAVAVVVLDQMPAVEFKLLSGARFSAALGGLEVGSFDVYYDDGGSAPVAVSVGGATVLLQRGSLRAERTADGVQVSVGDGQAVVYGGELPAGGVAALTDGVTLDAANGNSLTLAADGTLGDAVRIERVGASMLTLRSTIMQRSLLPDLVRVAEQVTEGDIEPPTRGAQIPAVAVAPQVRIPEIVPRGSLASQVISGSQGFASGSVQATAETFIGSGSAALAVVGVRLQRTRITRSFAAGGPLSISRELLRPFTIGPIRP